MAVLQSQKIIHDSIPMFRVSSRSTTWFGETGCECNGDFSPVYLRRDEADAAHFMPL
jgi:hypothetical protein